MLAGCDAHRIYASECSILSVECISNHGVSYNRIHKRSYDKDLYTARHLIENFFAKLKQYRAIATRYDKRAVSFLGAIYLAASVILLN